MFERMTSGRLYQQVVSQICRMILDGSLKKGDDLPSENQMCEQFGVSRTTVREAMKMLRSYGIIETGKGKKARICSDSVATLSMDFSDMATDLHTYFDNCHQVRDIIEPEAAYLVAQKCSQEDLDAMENALTTAEAKLTAGKATDGDFRDFHRAIVMALHNPVLLTIYDSIAQVATSFEEVDFSASSQDKDLIARSFEDHWQILDAIKSHDSRRAYFYMMEHLQKTADRKRNMFDYITPLLKPSEENK